MPVIRLRTFRFAATANADGSLVPKASKKQTGNDAAMTDTHTFPAPVTKDDHTEQNVATDDAALTAYSVADTTEIMTGPVVGLKAIVDVRASKRILMVLCTLRPRH